MAKLLGERSSKGREGLSREGRPADNHDIIARNQARQMGAHGLA